MPFINSIVAPLQRIVLSATQTISPHDAGVLLTQEKKSTDVQGQLQLKKLKEDTAALRDQFETAVVPSTHLVPARIVSEPGFLPGKTAVEEIIIDQGINSGIKPGMVVVYKNNLIGSVVKVTNAFSQVLVVSNKTISLSAKTLTTKTLGVVKGQGNGDILLDNVLLNQDLKINDMVVTSGNLDLKGMGYPPDLVVGKIIGVEKDPTALFQKASVTSIIDITKLSMVFVLKITN